MFALLSASHPPAPADTISFSYISPAILPIENRATDIPTHDTHLHLALHRSKQHVPLDEYEANLRSMVSHLRTLPVRHIILIAPPPVDEEGRRAYANSQFAVPLTEPCERTNAATKAYAERCAAVAAALALPSLDLWTLMQQEVGWQSKFFEDGLHFTAEGQRKVSAQGWRVGVARQGTLSVLFTDKCPRAHRFVYEVPAVP
jgi:lysophospholipase L1-like esterase